MNQETPSLIDVAQKAVQETQAMWHAASGEVHKARDAATRTRERVAAVRTEAERAASTDQALYHVHAQKLRELETEIERLGIVEAKALEDNLAAKKRHDVALRAEKEARRDANQSAMIAARAQTLGFFIQFLKYRAILSRHIAIGASINRELGQRRDDYAEPTASEVVAYSIKGHVIERMISAMSHSELREAVAAMVEGYGYAPYSGKLPYPYSAQLRDLLDGGPTFYGRARDLERRSATENV